MTGEDVEERRAPTRSQRRRSKRARTSRLIVGIIAGAAAIGGAVAGCHPTSTPVVDPLYAAGLAALITVACSRASRSTWLVLGAVAAALSRGWLLIPGALDLGLAFASVFPRRRTRRVGAAVGALGAQVILRWPHAGFQGLTALVAAAAVAPCLISAYRNVSNTARRQIRIAALAGAGGVVVLAAPVAVGGLLARTPVTSGLAATHSALAAASEGSTATATTQLRTASADFATAADRAGAWWSAGGRLVPVVSQQRQAVATATGAARRLTAAAQKEQGAVDVHNLGYHDGRLDLARIRALAAPVAALDDQLIAAQRQLAALRSPWLVEPLQARVRSLGAELNRAQHSADLARQAIDIAPGLLGGDGTRHYFLAFMTPAESRGLDGFIGAYGELTVDRGRISLTRSGPIADLNNTFAPGTRHITGPPGYLARYGAFNPQDNFQDLTYSPDFPTVAGVIAQMYPQSGGDHIDGVLAIDPVGLASLLAFTGPITIPGLGGQLTSANGADILDKQQYVTLGADNADQTVRHDLLQGAVAETFAKLVSGSLPSPAALSSQLDPDVRAGRILFWSLHPAEQRLLRQVGLAGAFPRPPDGDVVAVTTQNADNSKIDAYLSRTISDHVTFDPASGTVQATLTVALHNEAPASGLPSYVLGSYAGSGLASGTNRTWLSVYTPFGFTGVTDDGVSLSMSSGRELGVYAYSAYVDVAAGATVNVVVHLVGRVQAGRTYSMAVRQQPMVIADSDTVAVKAADGWAVTGGDQWTLGPDERSSHRFSFRPSP